LHCHALSMALPAAMMGARFGCPSCMAWLAGD
jgi:hypothetical protein